MHCLNITHCIKHGVKHKVHQVQRKQTDSHKICFKCPPLAIAYLDVKPGGVLVDLMNSDLETEVCHVRLPTTTHSHSEIDTRHVSRSVPT